MSAATEVLAVLVLVSHGTVAQVAEYSVAGLARPGRLLQECSPC